MFRIAALILLITRLVNSRGGIEDNRAIRDFYGTYTFIYAWPEIHQVLPDCNLVQYRKLRYTHKNPYTCTCSRNGTNLALVEQRSHYAGWPLLVDIVEYPEFVRPALKDNCACSPNIELAFAVVRKLNKNCFALYESVGVTSAFLLCKKVPKKYEINAITGSMAEVSGSQGQLMCRFPES